MTTQAICFKFYHVEIKVIYLFVIIVQFINVKILSILKLPTRQLGKRKIIYFIIGNLTKLKMSCFVFSIDGDFPAVEHRTRCRNIGHLCEVVRIRSEPRSSSLGYSRTEKRNGSFAGIEIPN